MLRIFDLFDVLPTSFFSRTDGDSAVTNRSPLVLNPSANFTNESPRSRSGGGGGGGGGPAKASVVERILKCPDISSSEYNRAIGVLFI